MSESVKPFAGWVSNLEKHQSFQALRGRVAVPRGQGYAKPFNCLRCQPGDMVA